jgi:hypothetical protein
MTPEENAAGCGNAICGMLLMGMALLALFLALGYAVYTDDHIKALEAAAGIEHVPFDPWHRPSMKKQ